MLDVELQMESDDGDVALSVLASVVACVAWIRGFCFVCGCCCYDRLEVVAAVWAGGLPSLYGGRALELSDRRRVG